MIVHDMHERSGNSQTGVRECFNTQHKVQFSKNFSTIAVLVCFLSTIQPKLGTMEESKYVTEKPVLSGYEKARRNFQQGEIFVAFVDPTKFSYYLAADSYGKTDGSSPQERNKAGMDLHHRGEIAADWVCGSGLRYLRKRTKVLSEAD